MKRTVQLLMSIFILVVGDVHSGERLNLERGVALMDSDVRSEYARKSVPYALFYRYIHDEEGGGSVVAMTDLEQPAENYALSRGGNVYGIKMKIDDIDITSKNRYNIDLDDVGEVSRLGSWPLTRWDGELKDEDVWSLYDLSSAPDGERWNEMGLDQRSRKFRSPGCLADVPLRYGDIEGNGYQSLVLYMGDDDKKLDMVILSPKKGQIMFSARIALQDVIDLKEKSDKRYRYRYISDAHHVHGVRPGRRVYAKLYFGDFRSLEERKSEDDPAHDILAWRKLFYAKEGAERDDGFELDREVLRLYRLKDDGYEKVDVEHDVLGERMAQKGLTWAKGHPQFSECEDENGQLIPEMHDPELNDPEVLEGVDPETMTFVEEEGGQKE